MVDRKRSKSEPHSLQNIQTGECALRKGINASQSGKNSTSMASVYLKFGGVLRKKGLQGA